MKSRISLNIAGCAAMLLAAVACTEEDYKLYDITQKDSVFFEYRDPVTNDLIEQVDYAYNFDIANVHTIEIPVTLMGMPKDYDRTIEIVPVAEETTMVEGLNYTITNNIIPANEVSGSVHINLLRDLDPEIRLNSKSLKLTIAENDDLKSVGENSLTITYSDIRPELRPEWWTKTYIPVYSFENAQLFFQYFYEYAPKANIDIYNEMIRVYGHYFVNAQYKQGPFAMYDQFLRRYVCLPFYREHPELEWQASPEF